LAVLSLKTSQTWKKGKDDEGATIEKNADSAGCWQNARCDVVWRGIMEQISELGGLELASFIWR